MWTLHPLPPPLTGFHHPSPRMLVEYLLYAGTGYALLIVGRQVLRSPGPHITIHGRGPGMPPLSSLLLAGVVEELVFRGLPAALAHTFHLPIVPLVWLGTALWVGLHARGGRTVAALPLLVLLGLFLSKFWYGGFASSVWWLAFVFHAGHNLLLWILYQADRLEFDHSQPAAD